MAPPCTYLGPLAQIWGHKWKNFDQLQENAFRLAFIAFLVAEIQVRAKRHYIIENPLTSLLWCMPQAEKLRRLPASSVAIIDQCEYGLKLPDGPYLKKATMFLASNPLLLHYLNRRCSREHQHKIIRGQFIDAQGKSQNVSRYAQVWPKQLCTAVAKGVELLIKHMRAGKDISKISDFALVSVKQIRCQ